MTKSDIQTSNRPTNHLRPHDKGSALRHYFFPPQHQDHKPYSHSLILAAHPNPSTTFAVAFSLCAVLPT